ncbi:MAG: hypothetical protein WD355_12160 [Balneolaceae bacterium]
MATMVLVGCTSKITVQREQGYAGIVIQPDCAGSEKDLQILQRTPWPLSIGTIRRNHTVSGLGH